MKEINIIQIDAGFTHCACVSQDGNLYTWGNSDNYQLGHGNKVSKKLIGA